VNGFVSSVDVVDALATTGLPGGLADILRDKARQQPHSTAVIYEGREISYGTVASRTRAISATLFEAGIRRGDKVGVMFPNHPDFVAAFFGVVGLGATVVAINPLLKADEIKYILEDSDARAAIVHEKLIGELKSCATNVKDLENVFVFSYGAKEKEQFTFGEAKVTIFDASNPHELPTPPLTDLARQVGEQGLPCSPEELAVLVYTSGTTGKPKGAMLSHGNLISAVRLKKNVITYTSSDRVLAVLPLCHIYGLGVVMLGILSDGGSLVIVEKFEAAKALEVMEASKVTVAPMVPAMFQFMALEMEKKSYDLSSLRLGLCGGAPITADLLLKLDVAFGVPIVEGYALTETACIATITPPSGPRKPGSCGPVVPGAQVRVIDTNGEPLPPGRENVGEVVIAGPSVLQGYYKKPEATAEAIKDGWFYSGDLGWFDEDGYLYICGRTKEMIIRGGQNIYPREIETVIAKMDGVIEAAVVGIPEELMGERVKAFVALRPGVKFTEDDVKQFCSEHLASYKVPRLVEFVDLLPRNSTGKVLKRLLIENN
jgi:Acyl-CoA synthetases (AMP-forming)/AMP-acid ligases II